MTRAEAYAKGYADGERWAEADARNSVRVDPGSASGSDNARAYALGARRGYDRTWERIYADELTSAMFEVGPR